MKYILIAIAFYIGFNIGVDDVKVKIPNTKYCEIGYVFNITK